MSCGLMIAAKTINTQLVYKMKTSAAIYLETDEMCESNLNWFLVHLVIIIMCSGTLANCNNYN